MVKFDKLGRRIPEFDRSAAGRKSAQTQKEKYGNDFHARIGADGGRRRTAGNFGKLKSDDPEALQEISSKGGNTGTKHFARLKAEDPEAHKAISAKRKKSKRNGTSVFGDK